MMVKISKENYNKMVKQAKDQFPLECCGLLAGIKTDDEILIKNIYPLTNIDQSSEHFSMDPKEQFTAIKQMRTDGHMLVGNYHSHPYTSSRPSEEDKRLAYDANILYGILSLEDQEPVLNFFKIISNELVEKLKWVFI
ncbi:Proteasome lid subunit RPN8/RPN11, contains Jab1/MPN metalloenzyme (JAMM) motif [Anaerovirgula multivorans]|uniref:Proteasome lid subunit RPN8/RPN11, contains Jab1/MPN metalloenzyme (JAMM) motif n=2 Tax=Anaerovirgula multivorans TaxID=312168 RepID=A0A239IXA7_9FIRM|nr:Proteasome lid subunit RPN8/RPN11, contains Jab1/MPN metalloenzyme (JAMM) motif [Anaerovirgula multivorans]